MKRRLFSKMLLAVMSLLAVACSKDDASAVNTQTPTPEPSPTTNTDSGTETGTTFGKTLVVFYSYTNNCREIVKTLTDLIQADVLEIQPADKGQKYEANNYAIGSKLLNDIKANPNDAGSYPAIDPVTTSLDAYNTIIIVTPLWWSQMAAIMQTYLFNNGPKMDGKNVGLIVSSASSGINSVVSDFKRLVPNGKYLSENLWINNSNRSNAKSLIQDWLAKVSK